MRIISTFKDYYDCMARYDDDHKTLFVRKKEKPVEVSFDFSFLGSNNHLKTFSTISRSVTLNPVVIFFAGKPYPFLEKQDYSITRKNPTVLIFDKEIALEYVSKSSLYGKDNVISFFDYFSKERKEFDILIQEFGPVFGLFFGNHPEFYYINPGCAVVEKNIKLDNYSFAKIIPPYVAYNELWKFVCNMNYPARPIPEMTNDIKIHQAGFDLKTSFRKPSTKKK